MSRAQVQFGNRTASIEVVDQGDVIRFAYDPRVEKATLTHSSSVTYDGSSWRVYTLSPSRFIKGWIVVTAKRQRG